MKKTKKKLALAKETVRRLGELTDLEKVMGGTRYNTACEGCDSYIYTCASENPRRDCPSYLC